MTSNFSPTNEFKLHYVRKSIISDSDGDNSKESRRIIKNLLMLSFIFSLLMLAFKGLSNLQSSIEAQAGLGVRSLAALYGAFILSSLFLPPLCLAKLTCKWTLLISVVGFIFYIGAQFYPRFETMIPAAVICGICSATMWAGQAAYITMIAEEYAKLKDEKSEAVLQRFFGIFYVFYQSAQVSGNLISSVVLSKLSSTNYENSTTTPAELNLAHCGVNFCSDERVMERGFENATVPEFAPMIGATQQYTLVGIFAGCTLSAAVVIALFLDSLERYGENERTQLVGVQNSKSHSLFLATIQHCRKPMQILIIPITIWFGMQEAVWGAEFTKAYITCAWGVEMIGYILICFGLCAAASSFFVGKVTEYCGRPIIFITAAALNVACIVTMFYWKPTPSQPITFFALSGVWGIADGVWSPQVKALYGTLFSSTREAAFSNTCVWMSIGFIIVYFSSDLMCMESKLYMYLGFLTLAMICYGIIEILTRSAKVK